MMILLTKLGDPRHCFLLYFPIAFFTQPKLGVRVLVLASVAEWLNAVLKW